jgi:methylated-DNA-[protein]-cysteine S-methyltransferase
MIYVTSYQSPVGDLTLAGDGVSLVGVWMAGQKYDRATLPAGTADGGRDPVLGEARLWLDRYFSGRRPAAGELPLRPEGGAFRQEVWSVLKGIPYGEVITYGSVAKTVAGRAGGRAVSARAVGGAVAHNPISIVIPCHRVVGADGSLTGYAGGIRKKMRLLELEGIDASRLSLPRRGTAL